MDGFAGIRLLDKDGQPIAVPHRMEEVLRSSKRAADLVNRF